MTYNTPTRPILPQWYRLPIRYSAAPSCLLHIAKEIVAIINWSDSGWFLGSTQGALSHRIHVNLILSYDEASYERFRRLGLDFEPARFVAEFFSFDSRRMKKEPFFPVWCVM